MYICVYWLKGHTIGEKGLDLPVLRGYFRQSLDYHDIRDSTRLATCKTSLLPTILSL